MNQKTLVVAPYNGMKNIVEEVVKERNFKNVHTVVGDLEKGLEIALGEINNGNYDLIISRGGTAKLLTSKTTIPILEIPITATDVMQALKMAEKYKGNYAIIGYENIVNKATNVCELMNCTSKIFTINNPSDAPSIIEKLKNDGYQLIIGDVITTNYCNKVGLNSILITSSKDTIEGVLSQSIFLKFSLNSTRELYKICFEHHHNNNEFCLIFNNTGSLIISSIEIEEISQVLLDFIMQKMSLFNSTQYYQDSFKYGSIYTSIITKTITIENQKFLLIAIKKTDIYSLNITGFQMFDESSLAEIHGRVSFNYPEVVRKQIIDFASDLKPLVILGENFTGKTSYVRNSFLIGPFKNGLLFTFNLSLLTIEDLRNINRMIDIQSLTNCALCFSNIQDCDLSLFKYITFLLQQRKNNNDIQIFFTLTTNKDNLSLYSEKLENIGQLDEYKSIVLPPLKERKNEFANLITMYINNYNILLGTSIISLTDEAFEAIKAYDWPGNLKQIKRVIKKATEMSKSYYIDEQTILTLLKREKEIFGYKDLNNDNLNLNIDDNKTLNEIISYVVKKKLEKCDYNQTKVAEELDISRTTVWRILKESDN